MENNLHRIEKDLRSIAKRYKSVKYSIGLAILFLMLGVSAFSEEVNTKAQVAQIATREELKTSVGDVQTRLNVLRNENKKEVENSKLELIQLMEQGDQVVKSPWASWQFGVNYFHEKQNGEYKGRGDKPKKYVYNAEYQRGDWKVKNAMDTLETKKVGGTPLTPGNDSQASWKNVSSTSSGGVKIEKNTAINSSTNGNRSWGLVDLLKLREPTNEVEILARISPKEVNKKAVPLNIKEPKVEGIKAPIVKPNVNTPLPAPEIKLPKIEPIIINPLNITAPSAPSVSVSVNAPKAPKVEGISVSPSTPGTVTAPTISINVTPPSITPLSITTPSTVTSPKVTSPNIKPVDFVIDPAGDSNSYLKKTWTGIPQTVNVTALTNRDYISISAPAADVESPNNQVINVKANNNRALVVDEAKPGVNVTYKGEINLLKSQNVGIDLQGTHEGSKTSPAMLKVTNSGIITGYAKDGSTINKEHIAFGFNNADASRNTTMSHMINENKITLNAPSSAAIQLKPEDPHYWQPNVWKAAPLEITKKTPNKTMGRVLMKAENTGEINLAGTGSFGMVTVFNKGVPKNLFAATFKNSHEDLRSEREYDGVRVLPGGEIGRSALDDDKYTSGIYNTGTINITGDNSIAVGLLQEIQEVKFGGNINIGTTAVTQETKVSNLEDTPTKTYSINKVEEAVGIFAGVPTMPVKAGEKDTLIVDNKLGNVANKLVGTETIELINNTTTSGITLGEHATESIGALVGDTEVDLNDGKVNGVQTSGRKLKRSGDIIARAGYTIAVGGYKNYGFVVSNSGHSSSFLSTKDVDDLQYKADKVNHGKGINEGKINVTGISSIGFALIKGGNSANKGTISVQGNAEDSIGFYGKEDNFSNTGTIQVTSAKSKNKAVVLDGTDSKNKINFTNTGNIYVNTADNANTNLIGTGNIGVYAQGNYKFDHDAGKLNVGTNAIGLYVKDATGQVNIKAPINLAASGTGTNKGTTVGIYSDGNAKVNFTDNTTLTVGEGAVGLYSSNPTNFDSTFTIANGKTLSVNLDKNSTFGLLNGNKNATASPVLSKFLNTSSTTGKIAITQYGEGASLFYATSKANAVLDQDYTITNGNAESTSVLVADNGATVEVTNGKTLTTNTNVGLIATKGVGDSGAESEAKNSGTIVSNRTDKGIGIYANAAKGNNIGTITMNNKNAVGMLGVLGSTLINTKKISLGGVSSAGMYGEDSDLTNSTTASEINVNKKESAGMYAKATVTATNKTSKNEGKIEIVADGTGKSAGMYSLIGSGKLTTENTGTIKVAQDESAGIFANNTGGQSEVLSSGLVKMTGINSVGIIGNKSKVTNSGTGTGANAKGIEISGAGSAGILATDESEVINSGRIEGNTGASLVGISVDANSTASNSGTITMKTTSNTGISSTGGAVTNSGAITLEKASSTGISSVNGNVTNSSGATITAQEGSSVGIYAKIAGNDNRTVRNDGTISLTNATPAPSTLPEESAAIYSLIGSGTGKLITTNSGTINVDQTKSVGIYAENNGGARDNSDVTNSGFININKDSSAGILAKKAKVTNTGTGTTGGIILSAIKTAGIIGDVGSLVSNAGVIKTQGVTPANDKEGLVGIALSASEGTNESSGKITLGTEYSTGMYGAASSTVTNKGEIEGTKEQVVGMAGDNSTVTNEKTIKLDGKNSTGLFGQNSSTVTNKAGGTITLGEESSVGIYSAATNISAVNKGVITALKKSSAGMLGNKGTIGNTNTITISAEGSAGMLGLVDKTTTGSTYNLELKNSGNINISGKESAGMMLTNGSASIGKDKVTAENTGTITLSSTTATNNKNIGIYVDKKATGINDGTINVKTKESVGMFVQKDGEVTNKKAINIEGESGVGIFVADDTSKGTNASTGAIKLSAPKSVGIFAKDNGNTYSALNAGTISLENPTGEDYTSLIGMFAQGTTGKKASVKNTGTINIGTKESVGIYAENNTGNLADVDLHNAGTININSKSSAGIYAPKSTVSKVGEINLKDSVDSNGSSAVYISEGGKVADTATAVISLGTANQNRVAYYVNGKDSVLAGANIGKVVGYGVGVYLKGNSITDKTKIDGNTPELNYTLNGANGNGIIGLFLDGDTDIANYNKGITVGNSVGVNTTAPKYAIGIYAKAQGNPAGAAYNIATPIKVGADGVGIYADKDSHINYIGTIEAGDGTTAGTGVFITAKEGANAGEVTINGSTIKLKGTGGVAVIASEGTTVNAQTATVELIGTNVKGVGVYAKKGSTANTAGWTFKNNGNQAEEVRSEEGKVPIAAGLKLLNPRMVLSHVINGETYVATGATVTSVNDGSYTAKENIGLMAEGVKNPAPQPPFTWNEADFEAVNKGTIDFSAAEKSTAIYVNSARAKNDGTIKVGKNSIAIYGFYDKNTRKYDGATGNPNKLEIETTGNSKISLGDQSTGMYLINAEKINNTGGEITSTTGAKRNVGIYAVNGQDADNDNNKVLTMTTATKMTLGDGAVGIYSKGQSNTVRNTVTNTGDITVGDKIVASKTENYPAVAVYAENTNLTNTSAIRVGNDGIAYYGKNSTINANGSVDFSNKGVLAYLENSIFISKLGNLGATQNTMLYLKDSTAQLDGAGTKVDIDVADGYTGAYISGNSHLTGVRTIKLGQGSTGLYLENTSPNFVSTAESISGTKDNARGIVAKNSNFTNNSKISLSGKESVGIYSNADATKNVVNNGELTLSGKKTLGVFLRGGQTFENKANINIADSANSLEPTIGIYTAEGTSNIKHTSGTIEVGEKSIGIYSKTPSSVEMNRGKIHVKDQGIGIYKEDGTVVVKGELDIDKHVATAKDTEPTGVYAVNGATVVDQASKITVGEKSYGFILNNTDPNKTNVYTNTNAGPVSLGNDSVFLYSKGKANITNNRNINSNNSDHLIGFYIKDGGEFVNNGIIDFSTGKGNIGVYAPNGKATNRGSIVVGPTDDIDPATGKVYSDANKIVYGIGMAADNGGHIINEGDIRISTNKSIGMYGAGAGTIVENTGRILLDGSQATATNKIQSLTGVYVDEGATFKNSGLITTTDSYAGRNGKINENVSGLTGVAVMNGSTLINEATGKILIDADNSTGVVIRGKRDAAGNLVRNAVIKNYGEIRVRGKGGSAISWKDVSAAEIAELERQINSKISTDPSGNEITQASGTSKDYQGITITVKNGQATFLRNGVPVSDSEVEKINKLIGNEPNLAMSDIGFYIDTLGRTRPVTFDGVAPPVNSQLIIGTEFSEMTNKKEWIVSGDVIKPFLDQIQGRNFKITTMAGSLTWMATPILDNYGQIVGMAMSKLAYTSFVRPEDNAYNFADGLEQRYDMNALDSAEKRLFNKLNGIGKNEDVLLTQAYDEMMGHQYANVQQRIQATGRILDKEFSYLRNSWSNPSKDSNKVKTFGMKGEYKTDTAGIIDYKNNAYGVAYVHEDETVKLGESTGWYTGIVHNTFKFEDIGKSKEEQLQAKVGLFRSVPFDDNNSLNWTISGDIFVGHNKLNRRFLVVDEIFQAKSKYYTYGIGVRNEVGKEFRLSEGLSVRPYGAVRVEYGRMSKIKEKSGEMKLEVKSNDYLSIRPEVGTELAYKLHLGNKTLRAALAVAYENELGRVANGKNKARVAGTSADWFNIRGEKEDRRGNVKTDLNVGVDNQRIGVTGNVGYDTKGRNVRGGLGLRVIF